jgi:hypothetical protein
VELDPTFFDGWQPFRGGLDEIGSSQAIEQEINGIAPNDQTGWTSLSLLQSKATSRKRRSPARSEDTLWGGDAKE